MRREADTAGFTLLEMVIAIAIFAIIAIVSYASLSRFLDTYDTLAARDAKFHSVEMAFTLLGRDFRYAADRPVRDAYGNIQQAMLALPDTPIVPGEIVRLTVAGPDIDVLSLQRLTRVAWRLENGKLIRVRWSVLDGGTPDESSSQTVLEDVDAVSLQFITVDKQNHLNYTNNYDGTGDRPQGVVIEITLKGGLKYKRIFELSDAT